MQDYNTSILHIIAPELINVNMREKKTALARQRVLR